MVLLTVENAWSSMAIVGLKKKTHNHSPLFSGRGLTEGTLLLHTITGTFNLSNTSLTVLAMKIGCRKQLQVIEVPF